MFVRDDPVQAMTHLHLSVVIVLLTDPHDQVVRLRPGLPVQVSVTGLPDDLGADVEIRVDIRNEGSVNETFRLSVENKPRGWNQITTESSTITVADAAIPVITAGNDLRIRIPPGLVMTCKLHWPRFEPSSRR